MTVHPVALHAGATVGDALEAMAGRGISSVLVLPLPESPEYGIVTMRDVVGRVVREELDPETVRLEEIVTWRPVTIAAGASLREAGGVMAQARVRRLPVVDGGAIIGLISDTDIFTALAPQQEWETVRQVRKERARRRASAAGPVHRVADLMSAPVLTIAAGRSVAEAVAKMVAAGISSLLVVQDGERWGIITKRDIVVKAVAEGRDPEELRVVDLMSSPVRTIAPETSIEACAARMAAEAVRRFPVESGREITGIISDSDILAAAAAHRWRGARRHHAAIVADVMRRAREDAAAAPLGASVAPEQSLWAAASTLRGARVRELPVVQDGRVIGTVTDADIISALEERGGAD
jgi:CBS domain-containing protein